MLELNKIKLINLKIFKTLNHFGLITIHYLFEDVDS